MRDPWTPEKHREHSRKWAQEHPEWVRSYQKAYHLAHKDRDNLRAREYNAAHRKEHIRRSTEWNKVNKERFNARMTEKRRNVRKDVIGHYGGHCACCGEEQIEFLQMHHIHGNGDRHREEISGDLYLWLKKQNYPEGFEALCANCHCSIHYYGYCPHGEQP